MLIHSLLINFLELITSICTYLYCKKLVAKAFYQPEIGAFNTEKTYKLLCTILLDMWQDCVQLVHQICN